MPAILQENNLAKLSENLSQSFKKSEKENYENHPAPTAKQVLSAKIEYEEAPSTTTNILSSLQGKYIILKPNQAPLLNVQHANSKVQQNTNGFNGSSTSSNNSSSTTNKLPQPRRVLFPKDKIQIGWSQGKNWSYGSGFNNIGNTCYLNSALQAFFHVPALAQWLISDRQHRDQCKDNCINCAMAVTLLNTQRANTFTPSQITGRLSQICKHLRLGHQEDAHEFLRYLIEKMEKSFLSRYRNEPWFKDIDQYSKETTPLNQILGGYLRSTVTCYSCKYESVTFQHFQDLPLDISKVQSVNEAISGYFSRENLEECGYKCESCKKKVSAAKKFSLERAPAVLCIQLKRFTAMGGKMSKHINISDKLNLQKYLSKTSDTPPQQCVYRLVSMITHLGGSSSGGHYTAIGLAPNGHFYNFDDCRVNQISFESALRSNAYVLFYELVQQPRSSESSMHNGHSIFHENGHTYVKNGLEMNGNGLSRSSSSSSTNGNNGFDKVRASDSSFSKPHLPLKLMPSHVMKQQLRQQNHNEMTTTKNDNSNKSPNASPVKNSTTNGNIIKKEEAPKFEQDQKNDVGIKRIKIERSPLPSVPRLIDEDEVLKSPEKPSIPPVATASPITPTKRLVPYESDDEEDEGGKTICKTSSGIFIETDLREIKVPSKQGSTISTKASESKSCENNVSNGKLNGSQHNDDPLAQLKKLNHSGYGSQSVVSWNDMPSNMNKEVVREQHEDRKRHLEDEEENEMDRGRVKKLKYGNNQQNGCVKGKLPNPFNEHQNMLNNGHDRYYERSGHSNGYQNRQNYYHNNNNNNNNCNVSKNNKSHFNRNFYDRPSHHYGGGGGGYHQRQNNFYKNNHNNQKKGHFNNRNFH